MYYLVALLMSTIGGFLPVLKKSYTKNTQSLQTSSDIYLIVNIPAATLYFFLLSGCSVPLNLSTLLFSLVYATLGYFSVLTNLMAFRNAPVVYITVISGAMGIIIPFLYEWLFTDLVFSGCKLASVLFRVLAICAILLMNKKENTTVKGISICLLAGLVAGMSGIVTRMYARFPGVESDGSFFFWTNIFQFPMIFLGILKKTNIKTLARDMKNIKYYNYLFALSSMLVSNAITFVSLEIIRHISGTVYSVLQGSVHLFAAAFISAVLYKEAISKQTFISVLLSVIAVVLSFL